MTNYVKITDGVVVQKQPNAEPGFIEASDDDVVCGMLYDGETFSNPPPAVSQAETQINEVPTSLFGGPTLKELFNVN